MLKKPKFFSIERTITLKNGLNYTFWESESEEHNRVYVPKTKDDFNSFIDFLYIWAKDVGMLNSEGEHNYGIIKKYPWLFVKNRWDGGIYIDEQDWFNIHEGDWLESLDEALFFEWQDKLLEEFDRHNENLKYEYTIVDTKEKYGTLRWYDNGCTERGRKINSEYAQKFDKHFERIW